jgi:hypothetical protein
MKWGYRFLRTVIVTAIILVAVVPAILYVALSLSGVQRRIADTLEKELTELLDAKVSIGDLGIIPFNRVVLRNVAVETAPGDTALVVNRLGAGVSLLSGLIGDTWRVDYVELIGMDARIRRDSLNGPLNIQPIINALQPKDKNKPPTSFDLKVSTVIIRGSKASYDVLDQPRQQTFDKNHLKVSNLRADVNLPRIANDVFLINLRRLALEEQSGFAIKELEGAFHLSKDELTVSDLEIELPGSRLTFADMRLPLNGINSIGNSLRVNPLTIELKQDSHVWLPDFKAFCPALNRLRMMTEFPTFKVTGTPAAIHADINLELENMLTLDLVGEGLNLSSDERSFSVERLALTASGDQLATELADFGNVSPQLLQILRGLGNTTITAEGNGTMTSADGELTLAAAPGKLNITAGGTMNSRNNFDLQAILTTDGYFDLSPLLPEQGPIGLDGSIDANYCQNGANRNGSADIYLDLVQFRGKDLTDVDADFTLENSTVQGTLSIDDVDLMLNLDADVTFDSNHPAVDCTVDIARFYPDRLGLWDKYPGGVISGVIDVDFDGPAWRCMEGYATISDLVLKPADDQGIMLHELTLNARNLEDGSSRVDLSSDWIDGSIIGEFDVPYLGKAAMDILSEAFPALLPDQARLNLEQAQRKSGMTRHGLMATNDFMFDFTIKETERLAEFFHLPVSVIYPVKINGGMCQETHDLELNLSAPFLRQGNKLIENSSLSAYVDGDEGRARLNFVTTMPTKGGPMTLSLAASGHDDMLRTDLAWKIDRAKAYEGALKAVTDFQRDENGLTSTVNIRKSSLTFNDSTWTVDPATISVHGKDITVDGLHGYHGNQYIKINGQVSPDPSALLTLDMNHFSLDYLFESLGIDAAMLGGDATGTFYASDLFSSSPRLETPGLNVKNISYNKTVLGDAVVRSYFNTADMAVMLDADIDNDGRRSTVNGGIYATRDSLDLTFNVDHEPVGFLQPYMAAFASNVAGYASGRARVFGNFKYIDLEGDVMADSVSLKINFTNTTYWARDSIHIRPGLINLNGITIHDYRGHTANLNGWLRHTYFKDPCFEFAVTGAKGLLSYDETAKDNQRWYGRIFGNGSAFVKGVPGKIDINIDMETDAGSNFTFVLSDQVEADEYSFLTFRDKEKQAAAAADSLAERDTSMDLVNNLRAQASGQNEDSASDYNITIQVGVTPDAEVTLVMDPVGGDKISAFGSGHLRMDYNAMNNDLKMYGTYSLDQGAYNFTLQDIIIKDFTIKPGSEIAFRGDPYAAQLNIQAAYSLNANLSDLDESFLNDNDLNRTNVPVNALMLVTGDIRQPEIAFDLEFPTLTSDVYRKVKSIISTDDMMNRQILYLLALNRFYTPDYMSGATKGNELVSVASSTISSQLGSILGQISDNWNIAPTFRSSRGDFSDVEVDVALSSRLLNNRLLFNGNFGYRDKSLNTNQFIGDFDLEYLLNRAGTIRLKAYNRYNDQNYYLRSALTTQGVGIILRKDFDTPTDFFRHPASPVPTIPLAPAAAPAIPADTIPAK